jgi:hypothetical protein
MPTYDIAAYQPTQSGTWQPALATSNSTGRAINGAEKLIQRFLLELTTELGAMTFSPNRGCSFLSYLNSGRLHTEADILTAFHVALITITSNLAQEETSNDPPGERFNGAELTYIAIGNGIITLKITVYNQTGQPGILVFPISLVSNLQG